MLKKHPVLLINNKKTKQETLLTRFYIGGLNKEKKTKKSIKFEENYNKQLKNGYK